MAEFDREDHDVISMCNNNPNRTGVRTYLGSIFTAEEARYLMERDRRLALYEAAQKQRQERWWRGVAMVAIAAIVMILVTVAALAG